MAVTDFLFTLNFSLNEWSSYPLLVIIKCLCRNNFELLHNFVGPLPTARCDFLKAWPNRNSKIWVGGQGQERAGTLVRHSCLRDPIVRGKQSTWSLPLMLRALHIFPPKFPGDLDVGREYHSNSLIWDLSSCVSLDPLLTLLLILVPLQLSGFSEPVPHMSQQHFHHDSWLGSFFLGYN